VSLFTPNYTLDSSWKATLNKVFQQMRRVKFVVEDTFSFGDFDPQTNWNGMTVTGYQVYRARYLKIYKLLWLSIDIRATLAAPFAGSVDVTIPYVIKGSDEVSGAQQSLFVRISNASTNEPGMCVAVANTNILTFFRIPIAAFTAGSAILTYNGFLEVQ
jgi:hypothetical protein